MRLKSIGCSMCAVNVTVLSHIETSYCVNCMTTICQVSNLDRRCNVLSGTVCRNRQTMCVGHYKLLQSHCKTCGVRVTHNELCYDDWAYCKEHTVTKKEQSLFVHKYLENSLNTDCIEHILSFL